MSEHGDQDSQDGDIEAPEGFKIISNRKFMTSGNTRYVLPSDDEEVNRLDYQHYVMRHLLKGNFLAPMEESLNRGIRVLDVGCGSGRWSLDMASDYPRSTFVGIDVTEVFPQSGIPPNLTFLKADTLEGLPFPDASFDYVFQRFMLFCFSPTDWEKAMVEFERIVKPGGWIELVESSMVVKLPPAGYDDMYRALCSTTLARGIDIEYAENVRDFLSNRGFVSIGADIISCPIGWQRRVGNLVLQNMSLMMDALRPTLTLVMGNDEAEYTKEMARMLGEFKARKSYINIPYAYGMRPVQN